MHRVAWVGALAESSRHAHSQSTGPSSPATGESGEA